MSARPPVRTALPALLASLVIAGCGGGDPQSGGVDDSEDDVRAAVREYADAVKARDFAEICESLTRESRELIEKSAQPAGGGDCAGTIEKAASTETFEQVPADPQFGVVTVEGDEAKVRIQGSEDNATLVKQEGRWRLELSP